MKSTESTEYGMAAATHNYRELNRAQMHVQLHDVKPLSGEGGGGGGGGGEREWFLFARQK